MGTSHILQKISSEKNLRGRPFVDSVLSLAHLRAQFIEEYIACCFCDGHEVTYEG